MFEQKHLVIVGCGKTKLDHEARAADLYTGNLFQAARRYAETYGTHWRIASAKYGLLDPRREIDPYDETMEQKSPDLIRQWGHWAQVDLIHALREMGIEEKNGDWLGFPKVTILAGAAYVAPLLKYTCLDAYPVELPLAGLGIGQRLQWLAQAVKRPPQQRQQTLFDLEEATT